MIARAFRDRPIANADSSLNGRDVDVLSIELDARPLRGEIDRHRQNALHSSDRLLDTASCVLASDGPKGDDMMAEALVHVGARRVRDLPNLFTRDHCVRCA